MAEPARQVQLVGSSPNSLEDLEWAHPAWMQLPAARHPQVLRGQEDLLANFQLQLAMVGVEVPLLVLLCLLQLSLGLLHDGLHLRSHLVNAHMLPSTHQDINRQSWELPKGPQGGWCASALSTGGVQP